MEDSVILNYVDIYGDIISKYSTNNIKDRFMRKYYFRKLKKNAVKFKEANTPISRNILLDYSLLIYSSFVPEHSFGHLNNIKVYDDENNGEINFIITREDYQAKIEIPLKSNKFRVIITQYIQSGNNNFDINLEELSTDIHEIKDIINDINLTILHDMYDYVVNLLYHIELSKEGKYDV